MRSPILPVLDQWLCSPYDMLMTSILGKPGSLIRCMMYVQARARAVPVSMELKRLSPIVMDICGQCYGLGKNLAKNCSKKLHENWRNY
jgi:hypothetical protein